MTRALTKEQREEHGILLALLQTSDEMPDTGTPFEDLMDLTRMRNLERTERVVYALVSAGILRMVNTDEGKILYPGELLMKVRVSRNVLEDRLGDVMQVIDDPIAIPLVSR